MSEDPKDQDYFMQLVHRYEQMREKNESYYFDVEQFEEIANYYCDDNKYLIALQVIEYAYSLFPENFALMLREAQILMNLGHLTKALTRLKMLEKIDANEEVLLTLAAIYSQQREHKTAIQILKKALALGSNEYQEEIYLEIALEYENMERYDKAQEVLGEAIALNPENEILLYEYAFCLDVSDKAAEAIEFFVRFTEQHPYNFPAWYNLANAYQKLGQFEDSIEAYDFCIAIQEDFTPAYYNKAHTMFKMDRFQEAVQVFEETYAFEQPQSPVYCHIGECFEKMNEYDKALFYYRKSISLDENNADAYLGMGITFDLMDKTQEGLAYVEKAIQLEPGNQDHLPFQLEFLKKLGRLDEAEAIGEAAVAAYPENEDLWIDYSDVFVELDQVARALELINIGWQNCPQSNEIGYRKVAYLFMSGKNAEAEELMLRLHTANPDGMKDLEEYYPEIRTNLLFVELSGPKN
jgi:tetratricopeptide (TPR) repeat protein